jgi:hypothetical protein
VELRDTKYEWSSKLGTVDSMSSAATTITYKAADALSTDDLSVRVTMIGVEGDAIVIDAFETNKVLPWVTEVTYSNNVPMHGTIPTKMKEVLGSSGNIKSEFLNINGVSTVKFSCMNGYFLGSGQDVAFGNIKYGALGSNVEVESIAHLYYTWSTRFTGNTSLNYDADTIRSEFREVNADGWDPGYMNFFDNGAQYFAGALCYKPRL